MKKFFYILGIALFSAIILVSCQTSLLNQVKRNLSEESQIIFSGKSETFYVTITTGKREEPYSLDGISRKKVDFSVVSINFFNALNQKEIEFEISINENTSTHIAEKSMITNSYLFDLEKLISTSATITITAKNSSANLTCKSDAFEIDSNKAVEIGTEFLKDKIEYILDKKGSFEVFLKLAIAPNNFDDVFVWYYILQSDIGTSVIAIIDCMSGNIYSSF